ncbi:MAG: DUF4350 domain-containing protein [Cytophagales bacterium]|nr:DUF4350 domain-containing protein [Cytophagales bacterium]
MSKERWIYIFIGVLFLLYVLIQYYSPTPRVWAPTYDVKDKEPYGAFILGERLPDLFTGEVTFSSTTLYQEKERQGNVLILTEEFAPSETDLNAIHERLEQGHSVLIAATQFSGRMQDSLNVRTNVKGQRLIPIYSDTLELHFNDESHGYSSALVYGEFTRLGEDWETLAKAGRPVLIRRNIGNGQLILCSAPLLFSNYGMLQNSAFAAFALSQLDERGVHYTQYYHAGRRENTSPFRYVLTERALTWALYLTLVTLICFLIINSRRKQRPTPVLAPPENTTVHFIKTMGALFFREKKHAKAAQKLAAYFFLDLQKRYFVKPAFTEKYYQFITSKTGLDKAEVIRTFEQIEALPKTTYMASEDLRNFQDRLRKFNYQR